MSDEEKIKVLEASNAKMFDIIIAQGEQIEHFEKLIEQLRKENEILTKGHKE